MKSVYLYRYKADSLFESEEKSCSNFDGKLEISYPDCLAVSALNIFLFRIPSVRVNFGCPICLARPESSLDSLEVRRKVLGESFAEVSVIKRAI